MAKRVQPVGNNYFTGDKPNLKFVSTGCTVLDCALGGGWALGRIANIVGDRSTAKTGIACETITNFLNQYPDGVAAYRDTEAAFDPNYARAMGLPIDKVDFGVSPTTVEEFAGDVMAFASARLESKEPGIYILDSLDALSDEAEMEREIGQASYGANKAKVLSELLRKKLPVMLAQSNSLLLIVSQVRDNIGAMFGEKHKRSGGKALDFYASQIVWLAHMKAIKKTVSKVDRVIGIEIRAKIKKNKVALPFREADMTFLFGYGVEDLTASIDYLEKVGRLKDAEFDWKAALQMDDAAYAQETKRVAGVVKQVWLEVETAFLPTRRKYG